MIFSWDFFFQFFIGRECDRQTFYEQFGFNIVVEITGLHYSLTHSLSTAPFQYQVSKFSSIQVTNVDLTHFTPWNGNENMLVGGGGSVKYKAKQSAAYNSQQVQTKMEFLFFFFFFTTHTNIPKGKTKLDRTKQIPKYCFIVYFNTNLD